MFPKASKILIVDDMSMFRKMVNKALSEMEYTNLHEANDGLAAWKAIETAHNVNAPFDLIISDWTMPEMKGIDLLKKLRAETWGAHVPFVLLTGEAEKQSIIEALQHGVTHYIVKPFTADILAQKLKQAYDKANANKLSVSVIE